MARDTESGGKLTSAQETAAVVSEGGSSTDPRNRLPGETAAEANARIAEAYKNMTAKPILTPEQEAAGLKVQFVRTGAGGVGEWTVVKPIGYKGDQTTFMAWTEGIIPGSSKYTTGTSIGRYSTGQGTVTNVPGSSAQKITEVGHIVHDDGSVTINYSNGTSRTVVATHPVGYELPNGSYTIIKKENAPGGNGTLVTYKDANGKIFQRVEYPEFGADGASNFTTGLQNKYQEDLSKEARQSAYDLLYNEFKKYGLESLVEGIKGLIQENVSPSEFAIRLQNTEAYKKRFSANQDRIAKGLRALTPAEYIGLEDQYQNIMRNYGLPDSYYTKDAMGTQAGFNKFIANDVSAAELEDRIATAQKRVLNADANVKDALRQFYPDITNADILAYTLDPTNALENIKRKVTAAEIGGAALGQGLATGVARAEELAKYGVTKAQAQQGYGAIGEFLPTAEKLGDIYANQGLGAYDQATAEAEVFGTAGAAEAAKKRKKLTQLEQAQFGGQAGTTQGALDRGRQGAF